MKFSPAMVLLLLVAFGVVAGCRKPTLQSSGGYVLTYRLADGEQAEPELMAAAMQQRLVAAGLRRAEVHADEGGEFVVELPGADSADVARAKDHLKQAGHLAFRIIADRKLDETIAEAALAGRAPDTEPAPDDSSFTWVRLDASLSPVEDWMVLRDIESGEKEILVRLSLDDVTGNELTRATFGRDGEQRPCIFGSLNAEGARKMHLLTSGNIDRRLGIILDGRLLSWPVVRSPISTHLEITGQFTEDEVRQIVTILKSGTLPARLADEPVSEEKIAVP